MLKRQLFDDVIKRLQLSPAVALLGCRQVGKTTLAHQVKKP
jgi:predicted AAA+ superfamily ATPase